ncbi:cytidyltransferase [Burkholderia lata]|uniref:Cytidyltransferase n=1 Tax=Burkholderia lata (strain ATCC 17760 / DSM 23089 / LMG 22485 / NCIMB 9086 / R18194 / 383) TaxID=482957 RepID=A0A6P2UV60_BURL3|nr:adenylyltransferase/cytidyltransferase family protein [Burkholderia lata]VWC72831.1 cytidyltransferase [Burkholderia lata]
MKRIGYLSSAFDLFHVGHLNVMQYAKARCDYLVIGVTTDEVFTRASGYKPVIPFEVRIEIVRGVRFVDSAVADETGNYVDAWNTLRFDRLFDQSEDVDIQAKAGAIANVIVPGIEVIRLPDLPTTTSASLRSSIENLNRLSVGKRLRADRVSPSLQLAVH